MEVAESWVLALTEGWELVAAAADGHTVVAEDALLEPEREPPGGFVVPIWSLHSHDGVAPGRAFVVQAISNRQLQLVCCHDVNLLELRH